MSTPSGSPRYLFYAILIVPFVTLFALLLMDYSGPTRAEAAGSAEAQKHHENDEAQAGWERSFPDHGKEVVDDSIEDSATAGAYRKPIDLGEFDREDIRCVHEQNANESWDGFDMALRKCAHSYCVQGLTVDAAMRRCTEESR